MDLYLIRIKLMATQIVEVHFSTLGPDGLKKLVTNKQATLPQKTQHKLI